MATMPLSEFVGMADQGDAYYNRHHINEVSKTRRGYDLLLPEPKGRCGRRVADAGRRRERGLGNRVLLGVSFLLRFDPQVRDLPLGDRDAQMVQELGDLGFRHLAGEVPDPDQRRERRAKLPIVAGGEIREGGALLARRVPLLLGER